MALLAQIVKNKTFFMGKYQDERKGNVGLVISEPIKTRDSYRVISIFPGGQYICMIEDIEIVQENDSKIGVVEKIIHLKKAYPQYFQENAQLTKDEVGLPIFSSLNVADLIDTLLTLRQKKKKLKVAYDEKVAKIDEIMEKVELEFLRRKETEGVDKFSSENGTVFWSNLRSVRVKDWAEFFEFAKDHPEVVSRTPAKIATLAMVDEGVIIPGIEITGLVNLNLREKKVINDE